MKACRQAGTHAHLTDVCMSQACTHAQTQLTVWEIDVLYQGSYRESTDAAHTSVTLEHVPFE